MKSCADHFVPVTLELGGKDPLVIFDDAEFEHAATICMRCVACHLIAIFISLFIFVFSEQFFGIVGKTASVPSAFMCKVAFTTSLCSGPLRE